jgi:two-component sensor histidine kinase
MSHRLPGGETAIADARRLVVDQLRAWGLSESIVDVVALTAHELMVNALRHGDPPVDVHLVHTGSELVVEVQDRSTGRPRQRSPRADEEHGRGLQMIDALATRWGSRVGPRGKVVWVRHAIPA